jgi:pSer/pThr/pTyr-binding forkhead associated (FHA) protein
LRVHVITHELIGDVITIGRVPSNDVVIDDPTVSAQHASLTKLPSGYRLKDLGSSNGTQINGFSITEAGLKDGAEIRFGYVTGVFRDATASIDEARKLQVPGEHDPPRRSDFQKRSQFFVRAHNEALTIATMGVSNEDRSPARIHG